MRMLIGMVGLLAMMLLYVGLVLILADQLPEATPSLVLLVFYIAGGLAWIWPAKWIILWSRRGS
jgi:uncharacterized protein DUF2842